MRGGLGKKQLTLFEHDGPSELHGEIMLAFPKLKDGGGYELLRIGASGDRDTLQLIPQPVQGFSVCFPKEVVRHFPPPVPTFFKNPKLKSRLRSPITSLSLHPNAWPAFGGAEFLSGGGGGGLEVESRKLSTA